MSIISQNHSGGDDEDCCREEKVPGEPGIQQTDERESKHVERSLLLLN